MTNDCNRAKLVGDRIKRERESMGLKPKEFLKKIYKSEQSHKTLANWENGNRMPDLDSLAIMAELFDCDIGYLLGDYDERTREAADVKEVTGLSEAAITRLKQLNNVSHVEASGASFARDGEVSTFPTLDILSDIIESPSLNILSANIGSYLYYREQSKKPKDGDDITPEDYERINKLADGWGMELISRKSIYESFLQSATDTFKKIIESMEVENEEVHNG